MCGDQDEAINSNDSVFNHVKVKGDTACNNYQGQKNFHSGASYTYWKHLTSWAEAPPLCNEYIMQNDDPRATTLADWSSSIYKRLGH